MEERKNNATVEKRIKDKLKTDRARIQVGRISGFGLLEMSRQRLRPGMLESTTQPCSHCHGTGLIRSDDSLGLQVLRALEEEGTRKRSKEVLLKAPIGIVNFLINQKREHIALIEARYGMSVRIECDPALVAPDYVIEKFKTATRVVPEHLSVISGNASLMGAAVDEVEDDFVEDDIDEAEVVEETVVAEKAEAVDPAEKADGPGKKKRRRRRRRRGGKDDAAGEGPSAEGDDDDGDDEDEVEGEAVAVEAPAEVVADVPAEPVKKTRTRSRKPKVEAVVADAAPVADAPVAEVVADAVPAEKPKRSRTRKPKAVEAVAEPVAVMADPVAEVVAAVPDAQPETVAETVAETVVAKITALAEAVADMVAPAVDVHEDVTPEPAPEADEAPKSKRKGWWSLGR